MSYSTSQKVLAVKSILPGFGNFRTILASLLRKIPAEGADSRKISGYLLGAHPTSGRRRHADPIVTSNVDPNRSDQSYAAYLLRMRRRFVACANGDCVLAHPPVSTLLALWSFKGDRGKDLSSPGLLGLFEPDGAPALPGMPETLLRIAWNPPGPSHGAGAHNGVGRRRKVSLSWNPRTHTNSRALETEVHPGYPGKLSSPLQ
jgi:hypothetical protein